MCEAFQDCGRVGGEVGSLHEVGVSLLLRLARDCDHEVEGSLPLEGDSFLLEGTYNPLGVVNAPLALVVVSLDEVVTDP